MLAISCKEMRAMDSYAINNIGIPSIVLMENAALKVIRNIESDDKSSFTVISGVGNNGGDGLAIARHLIIKGKSVDIFIIGDLGKGTKDFNINLNILKNLKLKYKHIKNGQDLVALKNSLQKSDLTIDSIFGIGLTREVKDLYRDCVAFINDHSREVLAIDIPSGLDGDTGEVHGIAVRANKTVTFHLMKKGLLKASKYTGKVIVENIGIPEKATSEILKKK